MYVSHTFAMHKTTFYSFSASVQILILAGSIITMYVHNGADLAVQPHIDSWRYLQITLLM